MAVSTPRFTLKRRNAISMQDLRESSTKSAKQQHHWAQYELGETLVSPVTPRTSAGSAIMGQTSFHIEALLYVGVVKTLLSHPHRKGPTTVSGMIWSFRKSSERVHHTLASMSIVARISSTRRVRWFGYDCHDDMDMKSEKACIATHMGRLACSSCRSQERTVEAVS